MALIETIPAKEDYRRRMALRLMQQGQEAKIDHWTQGLASMAQQGLGGYQMRQADERDKATEAGNNAALIAALGSGAPASPAAPMAPPVARPAPSPAVTTSAMPSAGAVPAALSGDRPGGPVMPSAKVWGDKEAEDAGIYEKPTQVASTGPVPMPMARPAGAPAQTSAALSPAQPVAAPAAPASVPAAQPVADAQSAAQKARIVEFLKSDNPQMRKMGQNMAQAFITTQMAGDKPTDEMREYNLYRSQGGKENFFDYKTGLRKAGATNVTTTVGGGSDKQIFDAMDESAKAARATATGLTGLREARAAIEGGAVLGAGADVRLGLQKVGALLGVTDPTKIVNTETFRAAIAPQVAAVLKSTVGTTNISNTDREFAEKAAGGNITLDEKSIIRLMDIMERASMGQLQAHQKRIDKVYADPEKFGRERALFGVDMPAALAPAPRQASPDKATLKKKYNLD